MKKISVIVGLMFVILLMGSCTSLNTPIKSMMAIEKGMSKDEVLKHLGRPSYRSFDDELEIWEFRTLLVTGNTSVVTVYFLDNAVNRMDTHEELRVYEPSSSCSHH